MKKILVLHAYSPKNAGDGLLVRETISFIKSAFKNEELYISLIASDAEAFRKDFINSYSSRPSWKGFDRGYLRCLFFIRRFDLVVGVGGGYLRAGTLLEALKTLVIHGPQLVFAATFARKTLYLPQSVGPLKFGLRWFFRNLLSNIDYLALRDDRSMLELNLKNAIRMPDLAAGRIFDRKSERVIPEQLPVLSVRYLKNKLPPGVYTMQKSLANYDCYIQSTVGGNDDTGATSQLKPRVMISRDVLMSANATPRVVVAMRLHAALMALAAGHYVIHLAYERKGFGAFADLGISEFVHNANNFSVIDVLGQIRKFIDDEDVRRDYNKKIIEASKSCSERIVGLGKFLF